MHLLRRPAPGLKAWPVAQSEFRAAYQVMAVLIGENAKYDPDTAAAATPGDRNSCPGYSSIAGVMR